jgi:hypothetical protein
VYGTNNYQSDHDFQVIVYSKDYEETKQSLAKVNKRAADVHLHTFTEFEDALARCEIYALECMDLPSSLRFRDDLPMSYSIDKAILRRAISEKANNSWVKAKKKLIVLADRNEHIALKSMFHSFRILDFGIQLAMTGHILNYRAQQDIWAELQMLPADWPTYELAFKARHNALASRFREVCPL